LGSDGRPLGLLRTSVPAAARPRGGDEETTRRRRGRGLLSSAGTGPMSQWRLRLARRMRACRRCATRGRKGESGTSRGAQRSRLAWDETALHRGTEHDAGRRGHLPLRCAPGRVEDCRAHDPRCSSTPGHQRVGRTSSHRRPCAPSRRLGGRVALLGRGREE